MAPEMFESDHADERSDIWALGVLLFEMTTGRLPFVAESEAALFYSILNKDPEGLTALRGDVPLELERIVKKALAKDAGARYQHVDDLAVDLRTLRGKGLPAAVPAPPRPPRRLPIR